MSIRNAQLIFKEIPTGFPEPGKTTTYETNATIDIENVTLHGGILVKTLSVSIEPFMRGRMRDPKIQSYAPAYALGKPVRGYLVARVLRSEHSNFKAGDHVYGFMDLSEYSVLLPEDITRDAIFVVTNANGKIPWSAYLGPLGLPGRTAYNAWKEYSGAKSGETAFITTGGGTHSRLVIQLAKRDGLKVIASAGLDEKVEFMKSIGADVAFNYKTTSTQEILEKEGPIDVYWDNVGGETLDLALAYSANFARFIECGLISTYNLTDGMKLKHFGKVVTRRIKMFGFIVLDLDHKYQDEFYKTMPDLVARGELKYMEDVTQGLEYAGEAILAVQLGKNKAKSVVVVADE
ncbi:NAD(P)-binding protein [Hymenopellis radicata]|nr:NAD(P)-binding protein [Hymenopellis radicata]